jgi:hypothetical protein
MLIYWVKISISYTNAEALLNDRKEVDLRVGAEMT